MNNNPHRGNSRKEKHMNSIAITTSAAVLVTLGFALATLPPTVSTAAEPAAPALAPPKTTAPTGPYHAGCLKFTTPGKQAVELFIQFRDGRALASHVLVDGKFYSPVGIGQHQMAPCVALDNVEGLRFDGTKLQGDWKWVTRGSVETLTFDATVRDGLVTGVCKRELQRELGLPNSEVPLIGAIGRLTSQKGLDLLAEVIPELMALGVQLVILGTGDRDLEDRFREAQARYPRQIGVAIGFDEGRAHRVEAGADMVVMPSRYEPCGLTQLYSLRYVTVPIVRKTGGLADTVVPYKPRTVQEGKATGFHFDELSADSLLSTILLAVKVYEDSEAWDSLRRAGMAVDSSWARAGKEYAGVFRRLVARR